MEDNQYIYGTSEQNEELREVKVKLPVRQVVALHGMKILKGKNVSEIVAMALEQYFDGDDEGATSRRTPATASEDAYATN